MATPPETRDPAPPDAPATRASHTAFAQTVLDAERDAIGCIRLDGAFDKAVDLVLNATSPRGNTPGGGAARWSSPGWARAG